MKKVILSAAALMFGVVGFAQVPGSQNATPVPNYSANSNANRADTDQYGTDQRLEIRQVGVRNSAKIGQLDAFGYDNNEARIHQEGPMYYWTSFATSNEAEANQKGWNNESSINQKGYSNDARTEQGTQGMYSSLNRILINQGRNNSIYNPSVGNYAYGVQNGYLNQSRIDQHDDHNDAWTNQTGSYNMLQVTQRSTPAPSWYSPNDGQLARAIQVGSFNKGKIDQDGRGARNSAYMNQYGNGNRAYQSQYATVALSGYGNTATVNQGFTGFGPKSYNAQAYQVQSGYLNNALMNQTGGGTWASNYGKQIQYGGGNTASMSQNFTVGLHDNYGKQYQNGYYNSAYLTQSGEGNKALQKQLGSRNYVSSEQYGYHNKLNTHQIGKYNWASTYQSGLNNHGLLVQYDGQSANMFQVGAGNSANIFQAGPNGGAAIDCGFDRPWAIPMPQGVPPIAVADPCAGGGC